MWSLKGKISSVLSERADQIWIIVFEYSAILYQHEKFDFELHQVEVLGTLEWWASLATDGFVPR